MVYTYQQGSLKERMTKLAMLSIALLFAFTAALGLFSPTSAAVVNGCSFTESGTKWTLDSDCVSDAEIDLPAGVTLDGDGHTITAGFTKTDNSNNAVIGILEDDVTVRNLTVDAGNVAQELHGFNIFVAENATLEDVTALNGRSGVIVNGSIVTVHNITTAGNAWHGMNVDLGTGVDGPAVLTVTGESSHDSAWHIYVDDITEDVEVIDVENQYVIDDVANPARPNDRLYQLRPQPVTKDDCKRGGWEAFGFRNQGQCVSYVNTGRDSR